MDKFAASLRRLREVPAVPGDRRRGGSVNWGRTAGWPV